MTEDLRNRIRLALAERGWTQADLVRKSGVDKNTISTLMTGKATPRPSTLGKIEAALGLTPGTLAAPGEDDQLAEPAWARLAEADLSSYPDEVLLAELGARLRHFKGLARDLRGALEERDQAARDVKPQDAEPGKKTAGEGEPRVEKPLTLAERRRRRMLEQGQPAEEAADDRGDKL